MKNCLLTLLAIVIIGSSWAQDTTRLATEKYYEGDTAMAAKIIDNYLSYVDFEPMLNNRMLKVVSYVVDADHPKDTLTNGGCVLNCGRKAGCRTRYTRTASHRSRGSTKLCVNG